MYLLHFSLLSLKTTMLMKHPRKRLTLLSSTPRITRRPTTLATFHLLLINVSFTWRRRRRQRRRRRPPFSILSSSSWKRMSQLCPVVGEKAKEELDDRTRDAYTLLVLFLVTFVLFVWLIGASSPPSASGFSASVKYSSHS